MEKIKYSKMVSNILKGLWIAYGVFSTIVIIYAVNHLVCEEYDTISKYTQLDGKWDVSVNGKEYKQVFLEEVKFSSLEEREIVVLETTLPEQWEQSCGVLRGYFQHSAVKVYIDGKEIYEYGYDRIKQKKSVGSGYHMIDLPDKYKGKQIKIELLVVLEDSFSYIRNPRIYEWKNIYRVLVTENRLPMFIGSFLVVFGLVMMVFTIGAIVYLKKYVRLLCVALFSICVGLWTLCYFDVSIIYSMPLYSSVLMEYMALYLAPIPFVIFMYDPIKKIKNKIIKNMYWILFGITVLFVTGAISLHTIDYIHCAEVLSYFHILIVALIVYFLIVSIMNLKGRKKYDKLYLIGIIEILFCVAYDVVIFNLERHDGKVEIAIKGISAFGFMVYIILLIGIFFMRITEKLMKEKEQRMLYKWAYTDELTQVYNRRFCTEVMGNLALEKRKDYVVYCFDVNNLKVINDTYGHGKGDLLIQSVSQVLSDSFDEIGIVGRMGGDEFIAIIRGMDKNKAEDLEKKLRDNLQKKNKEITEFEISVAWGYASGTEIEDGNPEKVYQLADKRMYENKKICKGIK